MSGLSEFLTEHVVRPLNGAGVPIDLGGVQLVLLLAPVALVVGAFIRASMKKQQRMRDAGM